MQKYPDGTHVKVYNTVQDAETSGYKRVIAFHGIVTAYGTEFIPGKSTYKVHQKSKMDNPKMYSIRDEDELEPYKFRVGDVVKWYKGDDLLSSGTEIISDIVEGDYLLGPSFVAKESELRRAYTHISPSALGLYEKNHTEFYMKYVARHRAPSLQQTQPMSIGSSFDAHAKSHIIKALSRGRAIDPKYEFKALFEAQVEPHNRDWAWSAGSYAFDCYKASGALADIMLEISQGDRDPRFEFEMKGEVKLDGIGVPLLGKPDLYFANKYNAHVVADWKVNGFCSRSGAAPKPGYVICRDGWAYGSGYPQSKNHRQPHKDAQIQTVSGIHVNVASTLEMIDEDWASQLATYGWLMGEPVGSPFIAGLEQLACAPSGKADKPLIRVASFRNLISKNFQLNLFKRYQKCWEALSTGVFFPEDNELKCMELEKMAKTLQPTGNDKEDWLNNLNRVR